ncbi:hypothetical protein CBS101457_002884 [Exobasidium rhododendri]|nr:hypothetical protein CBS101457_002884 [Exobasidium rhododendri]
MLASIAALSLTPSTDEQDDVFPDAESSWLHIAPRHQQTSMASSATLRQESALRQQDVHQQGSSSTPSSSSSNSSMAVKKRSFTTLPPPTPEPTVPLPHLPTPTSYATGASTSDQSARSSLDAPFNAAQLGPSGTIRGRPRGATVGAVSDGKVEVKQRVRPRSMLCNELNEESDGMYLEIPVASSSSSSNSSSPNRRRHSGISFTPAFASVDAESSSLPPGMIRTSSGDANSSSGGLTSGQIVGSEGGGSSGSSGGGLGVGTGGRSRSGSSTSLLQQVQYRPKSHASFVIAVVGHRGSGKSTVIKKGLRQFGLSKPHVLSDKITSHSTVCIVDHEQRTIEVLEMDASVLLNGPSKRFAWPNFLPHIDAVILCYDASQITSYRGMSELLENFAINSLSTVMLACKSEILPKAVDPYYASDMAAVYNVGLAECSVSSEEGRKRMKDCFSFLVKEVAKSRAHSLFEAATSSPSGNSSTKSSPISTEETSPNPFQQSSQYDRSETSLQESFFGHDTAAASAIDSKWRQNSHRKASQSTQASQEAVEEEEEGEEDGGVGGGSALQESIHKAQLGLQSAKSTGGYVTVTELWDKLFYAAVCGNDERFLLMIMVFYRGFAQPIDLLRQLISRFDALFRGEKIDSVMIRFSLMRLTGMLGDWMQEYPGDLSGPEAYPLLCELIQQIQRHPSTVHIVSPLLPLLEGVRDAPDLDAIWSKDHDSDKLNTVAADEATLTKTGDSLISPNSVEDIRDLNDSRSRSQSISSNHHITGNNEEILVSSPKTLIPIEGRHRSVSDVTTSSDGLPSNNSASGSSITISSTSTATTPGSLTASTFAAFNQSTATGHEQKMILRNVSNALFEVKDELIAQELTRIEWDLFSAVGSRDILRHILVSRTVRPKDSPVAKNIAHFNYVSSWVCSMILIQSKMKQRARLLEKFMEIGGILRRTNNYNTLHAILAGLGNASIHRLKLTRELLNGKPVIKTYQSLARLMGSDRSFAAYRLALENSEGRTIPYLGVHLQDILSMSDGNPSKRTSDGMVHWRKFVLMDDAVMAIAKCQQYQEPLKENSSVSKLILDLPLMDEDMLYQRSLQAEARQSSGAASNSAGSRIMKQFFHVEP